MSKSISGTVVYQNLGTGMWGIEGDDGQQYRPINMPEQIKYEGAKVRVIIKKVEEAASVFMWGTPVRVVSFHTLSPS